jgi:phage terminase small subunit
MPKKEASTGLSGAQAKFVDEYLLDLNKTQAAIRAGYSPKTAGQQGNRLFKNAQIRTEIEQRIALRSAKVGIKADRVLEELGHIGFSDIRDVITWGGEGDNAWTELKTADEIEPTAARAIQSIKIRRRTEDHETHKVTTTEFEVRLHPKTVALELMARHLNMFAGEDDSKNKSLVELLTAMRANSGPLPR